MFWELPAQYDICQAQGNSALLEGPPLNLLPLQESWVRRRIRGLQEQPSLLLRTIVFHTTPAPRDV